MTTNTIKIQTFDNIGQDQVTAVKILDAARDSLRERVASTRGEWLAIARDLVALRDSGLAEGIAADDDSRKTAWSEWYGETFAPVWGADTRKRVSELVKLGENAIALESTNEAGRELAATLGNGHSRVVTRIRNDASLKLGPTVTKARKLANGGAITAKNLSDAAGFTGGSVTKNTPTAKTGENETEAATVAKVDRPETIADALRILGGLAKATEPGDLESMTKVQRSRVAAHLATAIGADPAMLAEVRRILAPAIDDLQPAAKVA
jgi:hypothetical protein